MKDSTFASSPADWWLENVAFSPFEHAKGRHWTIRLAAMVFGTPIVLVLLLAGLPLLFFDVAREMWRDLKKG